MQSVILSIRPHWCREIIALRKYVEVRKSHPNTNGEFRVYLYETKQGRGAVVGECVCWFMEKVAQRDYSVSMVAGSCLTSGQISEYAKGKPIYGWYVAQVIEYEAPKPLSEFGLQRAPQSWCYIRGRTDG